MSTERMAQLDQLIYHLKGTANDIYAEAQDLGIGGLSGDDLAYVESEIFLCVCGWWCELCEGHEVDGEMLCDDCFDAAF